MYTIEFEQDFLKSTIILDVNTIQKLFEYGSDVATLYLFYHKQAKLQKTNQTYTTIEFVKKGLGWGDKRAKEAKKILKDLGLIEDITQRDEKGKITGHYVKLNYIKSEKSVNKHILSTGAETQGVDTSRPGGQETNALSNKNKNALSNKNKRDRYSTSQTTDTTSKKNVNIFNNNINNNSSSLKDSNKEKNKNSPDAGLPAKTTSPHIDKDNILDEQTEIKGDIDIFTSDKKQIKRNLRYVYRVLTTLIHEWNQFSQNKFLSFDEKLKWKVYDILGYTTAIDLLKCIKNFKKILDSEAYKRSKGNGWYLEKWSFPKFLDKIGMFRDYESACQMIGIKSDSKKASSSKTKNRLSIEDRRKLEEAGIDFIS